MQYHTEYVRSHRAMECRVTRHERTVPRDNAPYHTWSLPHGALPYGSVRCSSTQQQHHCYCNTISSNAATTASGTAATTSAAATADASAALLVQQQQHRLLSSSNSSRNNSPSTIFKHNLLTKPLPKWSQGNRKGVRFDFSAPHGTPKCNPRACR